MSTNTSTTITSHTTTKFVFPTTVPSLQNTSEIFDLGFVIGMSIMGGFILMVVLFMSITACQRAWKAKKKKVPLLPVNGNDTNVTTNGK